MKRIWIFFIGMSIILFGLTIWSIQAGSMSIDWAESLAIITGKIQKGGASATMKGFRAYFELPAGTSSGARLSFTDVTTGITTVMDASELGDDAFNLKGQRVDTPKKGGLYIIGGKKVIVK